MRKAEMCLAQMEVFMTAAMVEFRAKSGEIVWINPLHVARLGVATEDMTWVWFSYGGGELDIQVYGPINDVAQSLNVGLIGDGQ